MKNFKRILSSILVFCLLAGFAPAAFAADDMTETLVVDDGGTVVVGSVTVEADGYACGSDVTHGSVDAEGHVSAEGENATGVDVDASDQSAVDIEIDGDLSATGEEMALGVDLYANQSAVTAELQGDISVEGSYAAAITGDVKDHSDVTVSVDGDVRADGDYSYGILFNTVDDHSTADFTVGGDIAVSSDGGAVFIRASEDSSASLTVGGNITAAGDDFADGVGLTADGGEIRAVVDGSVSAEADDAVAMRLGADEGGVLDVSVGGDVSSSGVDTSAIIVDAFSAGDANLTVEGKLSAEAEDNARAALIKAKEGSSVTVAVNGGVDINAGASWGVCVSADGEGSSADVTIGDDLTVSADYTSTALDAAARDGAETSIMIDGSVTGGIMAQSDRRGILDVKINGDVSDDSGLTLTSYTTPSDAQGRITVTIEGTLSAEKAPINLIGTAAEVATLNVWTIKPDEDGNLVKRTHIDPSNYPDNVADQIAESNTKLAAAAEAFEKTINYIVKMLQPEAGGAMSTEGTTKQGDYDVAHEGDTVKVKLDIAEGYELEGVYNGAGERVELERDEDGNFFLIVPRGGGILLSADLRVLIQPEPEPEPIIVPVQKPAAEPEAEKVEIAEASVGTAEATVIVEPAEPAEGGEESTEGGEESTEGGEESAEESATAPVSAVVKFYDDKSFELVITTFSAEEPEKVDSVERVEGSFLLVDGVLTLKLADGREIQINDEGVFVITLPDGRTVRIKLDQATIGKLLLNA